MVDKNSKVIEFEYLIDGEWITIIDWFGGKIDKAKSFEEYIRIRNLANNERVKNIAVIEDWEV